MITLQYWINEGLQNIRFSGGEPTLYPKLIDLITFCKANNVKRIAVSTNGASSIKLYERLIEAGVNDFSISLDACCSQVGDTMAGIKGAWDKVVSNIRELSKLTYVTVGMVFTESNVNDCVQSVLFADSLGVSDIRVIPSAQYNQALIRLAELPPEVLSKYPILQYRIKNLTNGKHVRGIGERDTNRCPLVLDDMAVVNGKHFPCIIYMREQGDPIGEVGPDMRRERLEWFKNHDTHKDPICKKNCLDCLVLYNNKMIKRFEE
jgi:MoaA/NifB/PqqE/SkfB family radical SAM enzyme